MKKLLYTALLSVLCMPLFSQSELEHKAPTLQVGLDGLNFSKGTLDAKIIMQMVAEKQEEVALKVVQNMFLSKMEDAGGAFYSFTDNVIRGVVTERDPDVVAKKLLENTVNIAFTYAFADYYVRHLEGEHLGRFTQLMQYYYKDYEPSQHARGLLSLRVLKSNSYEKNTSQNNSILDDSATSMIALLSDMASLSIKKNETLKELGVMQVSYAQSYDYMNTYLTLARDSSDSRRDKKKFEVAAIVYKNMETQLGEFTNMIGLINYHIQSKSYRLNTIALLQDFQQTAGLENKPLPPTLEFVRTKLLVSMDSLQVLMKKPSTDTLTKNRLYRDLQTLTDIYYYVSKAKTYFNDNPLAENGNNIGKLIICSDIVYTLHADILPKLSKIAVFDRSLLTQADSLDLVVKRIGAFYKDKLDRVFAERDSHLKVDLLLSILSKVYQFDKANTFSTCVGILDDIEEIFPNERIKDALSFINTYVRDFVAIRKDEKGNEYLSFNIESLLSKLSEVKSDKLRRTSFLFTVGVNTAMFDKTLTLESGKILKNYSYVSEKIGVKVKIKDWNFWQTRNSGESYEIGGTKYTKRSTPYEPVVSNFYWTLYGSGILYNIVNTGTSPDFNYPLVATGFGWTFFNNLNLTLSAGVPILKNADLSQSFDHFYYGFSFDVPFLEYIKRASDNRKDAQNKKILAKLSK